jgi:glycerol-3-phosphate responsive antiterminator
METEFTITEAIKSHRQAIQVLRQNIERIPMHFNQSDRAKKSSAYCDQINVHETHISNLEGVLKMLKKNNKKVVDKG